MAAQSISLDDFTIRNTKAEEVDEFIQILEEAAEWLQENNIRQWPLGMFRNSRSDILAAIDARQCYMIDYRSSSSSVAGLFVINYDDPFDETLWEGFVEDWKDALYLHRLVIKAPYQGLGLTPKIFAFAEDKVKEAGRHYLRLDCLADNKVLRKFYGSRCRGKDKGGLKELTTVWNPELGLKFARFEHQVAPL
ncbi:hypothetical protein BG011_004886 [Mortierella polycephala]|uniref:N-acetyltransferase domain-containing protein n=1 Tax=Mortierella polycephala TaxID=41804 RepID=A0A9P6PXG4_9FUNG|nr:hypothetical protein BG011_004886 [Mortierella polycephala]